MPFHILGGYWLVYLSERMAGPTTLLRCGLRNNDSTK
jgi:hypothetical protein